jgi:tRNA pseudouridine55 synthase
MSYIIGAQHAAPSGPACWPPTDQGVVLLDKPLGLSSNHALSRIKRLFPKIKAGHTGCLDPLATGLLPICLGDATKFAQYLLDADKTYETTLQLGVETTTGDSEGEIVATKPVNIQRGQLEEILKRYTGTIEQIPPMYSALKYQGQPLYTLARKGITIERAPRTVQIFSLQCVTFEGDKATLTAKVSKGTYIRTLVEDIGRALGVGAHVVALRRTQLGPFEGHQMQTLAEFQVNPVLHPLDCFMPTWPKHVLSEQTLWYLGSGQPLLLPLPDGWYRFYAPTSLFVGIGRVETHQVVKRRLVSFLKTVLEDYKHAIFPA